jgi:hypothetical protein
MNAMSEGVGDLDAMIGQATGRDRTLALARYLTIVAGPYLRSLVFPDLKKDLSTIDDAERIKRNASIAAGRLAEVNLAEHSPVEAAMILTARRAFDVASKYERGARSPEHDAFIYGKLASPEILKAAAASMGDAAMRLQRFAGCGMNKVHTDCTLPELIDKLTPQWSTQDEKIGNKDYMKANLQVAGAADAVRRFLVDCVCAAFNPPCPPCDDTGVLLACFEVDHCKVVRICSTVRCYVLAPTTLRYWGLLDTSSLASACCSQKAVDKSRPSLGEGSFRLARMQPELAYVPPTQQHFAHLAALDHLVTLSERLVSKPAANLARAREAEVADLKGMVAALTNRIVTLEQRDASKKTETPERLAKPDIPENPDKPGPDKPAPTKPTKKDHP